MVGKSHEICHILYLSEQLPHFIPLCNVSMWFKHDMILFLWYVS